jgi:hypothetical protein
MSKKPTIRSKSAREAALALVRAWGAQGGKKGGKSRMASLTPEQRRALARKAARARWNAKTER